MNPVCMALRCAGLDGAGCPSAMILVVPIGTGRLGGLNVSRLYNTCERAGWVLAAGDAHEKDNPGNRAPLMEPLCSGCGAKLAARIEADGQGQGAPGPLAYLRAIQVRGQEQ